MWNKKTAFLEDTQDLANFAKALSHPARIQILLEIARRNECICGEIVEVMPLAQSTVSQHLNELKKAGLIKGETEGAKSCYCIDWEVLNKNFSALEEWKVDIQTLQRKFGNSCCD